jgi:RhtB (resistance to homoserine/threonine) family protein
MDYLPEILTVYLVYMAATIAPGPAFVVITGAALGVSRRHGVLTALGVSTGTTLWVTATLLGLSVILAEMGFLARAIRLAGGTYLVYLGVMALRSALRPGAQAVAGPTCKSNPGGAYLSGLLVSLSNPKSAIFFVSVMSLLLTPETPLWAKLVSGGGIVVLSFGWYSSVACLLSHPAASSRYRRARRPIQGLLGALLTGFGGHLMISR